MDIKLKMDTERHGRFFRVVGGKIYFSKMAERRFFFVLTLGMLIWGILSGWIER